MAEEKKQSVTVYSYRKVWFVEKKIYAFQNIVLPFPKIGRASCRERV